MSNDTQMIPNIDVLATLSEQAERQITLERQIEDAEEVVKALKEAFREVSQQIIPKLMDKAGMSEFKLKDGSKVSVTPFYAGKITSDAGYEWLKDNGHGDMVKSIFEVQYPFTASEEELEVYLDKLNDLGLNYIDKKSVHHMTLGAWLKEQDLNGSPAPIDLFNVYQGYKTKISR